MLMQSCLNNADIYKCNIYVPVCILICTTLKICADKYLLNMFNLFETERWAHPEIVYNDYSIKNNKDNPVTLCVFLKIMFLKEEEEEIKTKRKNRGWMRQPSIYIPA